MIYSRLTYLPEELQTIYIKKYKYLDVMLTYITLSKGHSSYEFMDPQLFSEYLKIAIILLSETKDVKGLVKLYKKKIRNLANETFILTPTHTQTINTPFYSTPNSTYIIPPNNYDYYNPPSYPPIYSPSNNSPNPPPPPNNPPPTCPPHCPSDNGDNGSVLVTVLKYSLRDRYKYMMDFFNISLLNRHYVGYYNLWNKTADQLTFNDLIRAQQYVEQYYYEMYPEGTEWRFIHNRRSMIRGIIKLVHEIMYTLQTMTNVSYKQTDVPLGILLAPAQHYSRYEPEVREIEVESSDSVYNNIYRKI